MKSFKDTLPLEESAIFKVDIEGLPAMYINGKSAGDVKNQLRPLLKNPGDVIKTIDRVLPTDVKKDLRLRLTGKADLEGDDVNEAVDPTDTGGEEEVSMAMNQVKQIRHYVDGIEKMVKADGDMEEWVQNKLTKATDYLKSVYGYKTGKSDTNESYIPEGMAQTHAEIKKAMGNIKHKIVMRGKKHFVQVDQNDEKDAQAKIKNHPLYVSGNLRLMPINESTEAYGKSQEHKREADKNANINSGDKKKLGAIAQLMDRERRQKKMADDARKRGDTDAARKHDVSAQKARQER